MNNNGSNGGFKPEFRQKLDLLKLNNAGITILNNQPCIVIPVNFNPSIEVKNNDRSGAQEAVLTLAVFRKREQRGAATHSVSCDLGGRYKEFPNLSREQKKQACPTIGNLFPAETPQQAAPAGGGWSPGVVQPAQQLGGFQPQGGYSQQGVYPQQAVPAGGGWSPGGGQPAQQQGGYPPQAAPVSQPVNVNDLPPDLPPASGLGASPYNNLGF